MSVTPAQLPTLFSQHHLYKCEKVTPSSGCPFQHPGLEAARHTVLHFPPRPSNDEVDRRLKEVVSAQDFPAGGTHPSQRKRSVAVFDGFFSSEERDEMQETAERLSSLCTHRIYSSYAAQEAKSEETFTLPKDSNLQLLTNPPNFIERLYELLSFAAKQSNMQVSTVPIFRKHPPKKYGPCTTLETCSQKPHMSFSALRVNLVKTFPYESMMFGIHTDGVDPKYSPVAFDGSSCENLDGVTTTCITLLVYLAGPKFDSSLGSGTAFFNQEKDRYVTVSCRTGRFVLFPGDAFHSISNSTDGSPSDSIERLSLGFHLVLQSQGDIEDPANKFIETLINLCANSKSVNPENREKI